MPHFFAQIKLLNFDFWSGDGRLLEVEVDLAEDEKESGCQFSFYDPDLSISSYLFQLSQASGGITTPPGLLDVQGGTIPVPAPGVTPTPGQPGQPGASVDPTPGTGVPGRTLTIQEMTRFCEPAVLFLTMYYKSKTDPNDESKDLGYSGTAFLVESRGTFITVAHNWGAANSDRGEFRKVIAQTRDWHSKNIFYPSRFLFKDDNFDIAIGEIDARPNGTRDVFPVLQVASAFDLAVRAELYCQGYSDEEGDRPWDIRKGILSRAGSTTGKTGRSEYAGQFETTGDMANSGDSGAPVWDKRGVLYGVHSNSPKEGAGADDLSYGTRVDVIRSFFRSKMGRDIAAPNIGQITTTPTTPTVPGLPPSSGTPTPSPSPTPAPTPVPAPTPPSSVNPPGTAGKTSTGIFLSDAPNGLRNDALAKKIIEYCYAMNVRDIHHVAYILATCQHESAMGIYSEEIASGAAYEGRSDLGNTQPGDGVRFKGRGYVQITGRNNYNKFGRWLGEDFLTEPRNKLPAEAKYAIPTLVCGMTGTQGSPNFTGRVLKDYGSGSSFNATNARRTVNGTDRASLIAGYYRTWLTKIPNLVTTPTSQPLSTQYNTPTLELTPIPSPLVPRLPVAPMLSGGSSNQSSPPLTITGFSSEVVTGPEYEVTTAESESVNLVDPEPGKGVPGRVLTVAEMEKFCTPGVWIVGVWFKSATQPNDETKDTFYAGTAFMVEPRVLLTAGHNWGTNAAERSRLRKVALQK
jgi:S1-C subfamily serine protease